MLPSNLKHWLSLGFVSLVTVACGSKAMMEAGLLNSAEHEELFIKSLEVVDVSGDNKVYLTIKSNDAELLEAYSPAVFKLTALYERSPLTVLEDDVEPSDLGADPSEPEPEDAPFLEYEVTETDLVSEAMGFRLEENVPAGHQPFFIWRYSYSYEDCFRVRRDSVWSRVYLKAWIQAKPDSAWLPWLNKRHLKESEIFTGSMPASHQLKIGIKARSSADYALEFFQP